MLIAQLMTDENYLCRIDAARKNKYMSTKTKRILSLTSVLFLTTFYGCDRTMDQSLLESKQELVVAMDIDMPGYFAINDESFGYQFDLLQNYADERGLSLRIIDNSTTTESKKLFNRGGADIIAALSTNLDAELYSVPFYKTSFVILANSGEAAEFRINASDSIENAIGGKSLLVSPAFTSTKSFKILLEALNNTETSVSSGSCIDMVEMMRNGEYDYVICEKSEAQMSSALMGGVSQVYDFSEELDIRLALSPKVTDLEGDFVTWLTSFRKSEEYAMLNDIYFETGIVGQMIVDADSKKSFRRGISDYDHLMREISEREGLDWRFLSAIAYHESRFRTDVVSSRGARGIMQIMPIVARQFNVPQEDVMKPEVNILLAAKLLGKIEAMLKFSDTATYDDKMSILLACYNSGISRVMNARKVASEYGYNPDSWADISPFVRSGETLAFVSNVMDSYSSYCAVVRK